MEKLIMKNFYNLQGQDSEGSFIDENNNEIKFKGVIDYINKRFGGNKEDPFLQKKIKKKL